MNMHPVLTNVQWFKSGLFNKIISLSFNSYSSNVNDYIAPSVTPCHPADLESEDSAAGDIETTIKHCMDAKVMFILKMAFGPLQDVI